MVAVPFESVTARHSISSLISMVNSWMPSICTTSLANQFPGMYGVLSVTFSVSYSILISRPSLNHTIDYVLTIVDGKVFEINERFTWLTVSR